MRSSRALAHIRYTLPGPSAAWELGEESLPVSFLHDELRAQLRAVLVAWAERHRPDAVVANDVAVRWDREHPSYGVDPDVAVFDPGPPDVLSLRSVCTWKEGHVAPFFAIEVVSQTDPRKDYSIAPDKYAASGAGELVVFDPLLCGPQTHGGPFRLQVWRRDDDGAFTRVHAGEGPAYSAALAAHLVVVDEGRRLRISDDASGERLWLTGEEGARAREEAAHARIVELEAALDAARREK